MKYKVGMFLKGNDNIYNITNQKMTKGRVIDVGMDDYIRILVLEHEDTTKVGVDYGCGDVTDEMFETIKGFKVGDKVKVRTDLKVDKKYGEDWAVYEMAEWAGKVVTIACIKDNGYKIMEDSWNWTDEMFESNEPIIEEVKTVNNLKAGDKVFVRNDLIIGKNYDKYNESVEFVSEMVKYLGQEVTIDYSHGCKYGCYAIQEDDREGICKWHFSPEMLTLEEPIKNTRLKVGDRVMVKKDLKRWQGSNGYFPSRDMIEFAGTWVTITENGKDHDGYYYNIEEDNDEFGWTDEMFDFTQTRPPVKPLNTDPEVFEISDIVVDNKEENVTYITIGDRITLAFPKDKVGIAMRNPQDEPCDEIGKALAFKRLYEK